MYLQVLDPHHWT